MIFKTAADVGAGAKFFPSVHGFCTGRSRLMDEMMRRVGSIPVGSVVGVALVFVSPSCGTDESATLSFAADVAVVAVVGVVPLVVTGVEPSM